MIIAPIIAIKRIYPIAKKISLVVVYIKAPMAMMSSKYVMDPTKDLIYTN
jgi:hypothetical protein